MKRQINIFILYFFAVSANAQSNLNPVADSIRRLIEVETDLEKTVDHYYKIGDAWEHDPDSALFYYNKARQTAQNAGYESGIARYGSHALFILNHQGKYREGLDLAIATLEMYKRMNDPKELSTAYLNVGNQWHYLSDFQTAATYYIAAGRIADSLGDKRTQRSVANNLSSVFTELKQFEKAEKFGLKALELAIERKDSMAMLSPLYNLASINFELKQSQKALDFIERFEQIAQKNNNAYDLSDAWLSKGRILGESHAAAGVRWLNQSIEMAQKEGFPQIEFYAYRYLADIYYKNKNYTLAIQNTEKGIEIAEKLEAKYELADMHKITSEAYEALGDFANALKHSRRSEQLNNEIKLEDNKNQILNIEAKYQLDKKESEIAALNAQNTAQQLSIRQKNLWMLIFLGTTFFILVIGFLIYRNFQNKRKINLQRIAELETEKQLQATQALLQGQEVERSRLAKELHDGLGGLLSGAKLNLSQMHKKIITTEDDAVALEKSILLLDESIRELRRVAHNMMPESIALYGLDGAIRDFLNSVDHESINITYQSFNLEKGLNKQLDISVYRIIQELVNNVMKHSGATELLVQIRKDDILLLIDVEDNGKGFDLEKLPEKKGMGLAGIQSRVKFFKGNLHLDSSDSGTFVNIEIPLENA